jgi:hypothetical protein
MKNSTILLTDPLMKGSHALFLTILLISCGCTKLSPPVAVDAVNWSKSEVVSQSADSLISSFMLYKWNKSLIALNNDAGQLVIYFLQDGGTTWKEKINSNPAIGNKPGCTLLDCDPVANRFISVRGTILGDTMEVIFSSGSISSDGSILVAMKPVWRADKTVLFGKTGSNVTLWSHNNRPITPVYTWGTFSDSVIYIPYSIHGETRRDRAVITAEGPFDNGAFCSLDGGETWQREHISSSYSYAPHICKTKSYYYYIADTYADHNELWYSRKPVPGGTWSKQATINKSSVILGGMITSRVTGDGDNVHICWLDQRHTKESLLSIDAYHGNYEVVYRHCKDSDGNWGKEIILSEGLKYAYCPVVSVEGDKIVVAWAGAQSAPDGHAEKDPNDIYYVTSKDGGETWAKPLKATDGAKDGITSGKPQVMLLNGVIHLFYIQGTLEKPEQISPGLTKLNQPPWPIYYTQRQFPD